MPNLLNDLQAILPITSLFRTDAPIYLLAAPFLLSTLEGLVMIHLALRSIGYGLPIGKTIIPGIAQGVLVFLARQTIPIPYHILFVIIVFVINIKLTSGANLIRSIIATIFTESVVFVGSIITLEPLLIISKSDPEDLLADPMFFTLGTVLETVFPMIVLFVLIRFKFSIVRRPNDHGRHQVDHENRQV